MNRLKAQLIINKDFILSRIDSRIYGSFIEHMGRCIYQGIYYPESQFSDEEGFNQDVINKTRKLNIPIIRYPGGNFVSGYNWEDGTGPREKRPVRLNLGWNSIETNEVGLNEFLSWCKKVNTKPIMAVNLGTRGAQDACNILEYCNFTDGTYWSDLRICHGYKKPHNIKVWCLGNEMDGPWQICKKNAGDYGRLVCETGKMMKRIDRDIELVVCGSSGTYLDTYPEWDAEVLEQSYDYADYISAHMYIERKGKNLLDFLASTVELDNYIKSITAVCDYIAAKKRGKKKINLSFDEWNVIPKTCDEDEKEEWKIAPRLCECRYTMADTLVFCSMLLTLIRHCGRVKIACLAQLVNILGPVMTADNGKAWLQTIYYPYLHVLLYGKGYALLTIADSPVFTTKEYGDAPLIDSIAVFNDEKEELVIFAVNRSLKEYLILECKLSGFEEYSLVEHIVLGGVYSETYNSYEHPDNVIPYVSHKSYKEDGLVKYELPQFSWNVIRMKKYVCK